MHRTWNTLMISASFHMYTPKQNKKQIAKKNANKKLQLLQLYFDTPLP